MTRFPALTLWWQARSRREQGLLAVLGGVALVALLLVAMVKPLQAMRSEAAANIRLYQSLAARLRAGAGGDKGTQTIRTGDTATLLSITAAAQGLAPRITADGTAEVTDSPYESVLRWIAEVEATTPLRLARTSITRSPTPGRVTATLVFRR